MLDRDYQKTWNEKVSDVYAHRILDDKAMTEKNLFACYQKGISSADLNEKTIIDFGCGGGFFGKFCFDNFLPKKYIGLDIAQKSIDAAKTNLEYVPEELIDLICGTPSELLSKIKSVDVLCSFSVIQHFPDEVYLRKFLSTLNASGIKQLFLQIRYLNDTRFFDTPYTNGSKIRLACYTNAGYINEFLGNYTLESKTKLEESLYQYLTYALK